MAQTTGGMSMRNLKIEMSENKTSWDDISGFANLVEWDGGERATEKTHVFEGDRPLLSAGKLDPVKIHIRIVYTEGSSEPTAKIQAAYEACTPVYFRWSPKGGQTGSKRYTTDACTIKKPMWPKGEAESAATVLSDIEGETSAVTPEDVA